MLLISDAKLRQFTLGKEIMTFRILTISCKVRVFREWWL